MCEPIVQLELKKSNLSESIEHYILKKTAGYSVSLILVFLHILVHSISIPSKILFSLVFLCLFIKMKLLGLNWFLFIYSIAMAAFFFALNIFE